MNTSIESGGGSFSATYKISATNGYATSISKESGDGESSSTPSQCSGTTLYIRRPMEVQVNAEIYSTLFRAESSIYFMFFGIRYAGELRPKDNYWYTAYFPVTTLNISTGTYTGRTLFSIYPSYETTSVQNATADAYITIVNYR